MDKQYYSPTQARVRSFRQRKGISNENTVQALAVAVLIAITPIIVWDFMVGQRDLTSARVEYTQIMEGR